jgi:hypothetical protein
MPSGLQNWSTTAAANATADSAINWAEGMAPSAVNDSARAMMAVVAKHRDDTAGTLTTAGSSTAYTLTTNTVFTTLALLSGQKLKVRFNAANGASPTLNVDGLGAKAIQVKSGTAVGTGVIGADSVWDITYDNSIPAFLLSDVPAIIQDGTVATPSLAATSVTAAKLAADAVETAKILDANVTAAKLATDAVETAKIKDANVTFAKFASAAVAAQSDMETGTSTTTIVTPGRFKNHPLAPKAWAYVTVSGGTATVAASSGISSVTRNAAGDFICNLSTNMSSANYAVMATPATTDNVVAKVPSGNLAVGAFHVNTVSPSTNTGVDANFSFIVLGDQ